MSIMNTQTVTRINITLPVPMVSDLKKYAPERGVSNFLAEAAKEKIERIEKEKAFKELLAAPATFTRIKDAQAYVRKTRRLDEKRSRRLGI